LIGLVIAIVGLLVEGGALVYFLEERPSTGSPTSPHVILDITLDPTQDCGAPPYCYVSTTNISVAGPTDTYRVLNLTVTMSSPCPTAPSQACSFAMVSKIRSYSYSVLSASMLAGAAEGWTQGIFPVGPASLTVMVDSNSAIVSLSFQITITDYGSG
jgi:hypothetical protein